ncbi:MAG: ABC-2 transporter permease [Terrisporobacter othiniensis]|uniref:ABC-2 transporter permease n=1 Tax=Terrisporobacter othiniensis TaxID=1577792 RepID=UPI002910FC07|nr:ABC-2 transporter permease [Terrisporobacter othiniensis]MDU6984076.1 ABC-2 transporter permease [Terrisporobacter othiniensis]
MTDIKKLLKFDLKFLKGYYKSYIFIALFMLFVFGNMVFNMGALILAFYYSLDTDENYKKVNSLVQTLPINNKEYISYKYISSFMQLILILIMFLIATILILISEKISTLNSDIFLLSWVSNHIIKGNGIQANYFIRFVTELFMAIVTICVIIPTQYNKSKKQRVLTWLILLFVNSMVGTCLTKDYTWVIFDILSKFNEIFIVLLEIVLSHFFIKISFNKSLQLYTKSEII